jgi:uncharacterized protein YuzE
MDIALSVEGVPSRLTAERWFHIVENHDDMAGYYDDILETVENPDGISKSVFRAVPLLVDFPVSRFWVDYDQEADVLYISFQRPQKATDTEMTDEGILLRYRGKQLVGITVLDASTPPIPENVYVRPKAA